MKSIIIYYSYSGNTKRVANALADCLKQKGEVSMVELKSLDEAKSFFGQCRRAFRHKRAEIQEINFDLSKFDLVCFGTPLWAFAPAPAINTCLDKCSGLENKKVILFTTFGSGTGNNRCLSYMQDILSKKNVKEFRKFSIQQRKVKNQEFVISQISHFL